MPLSLATWTAAGIAGGDKRDMAQPHNPDAQTRGPLMLGGALHLGGAQGNAASQGNGAAQGNSTAVAPGSLG